MNLDDAIYRFQMDFDFGDYYDHTNEIIEKVLEVIDKCMEESECV